MKPRAKCDGPMLFGGGLGCRDRALHLRQSLVEPGSTAWSGAVRRFRIE